MNARPQDKLSNNPSGATKLTYSQKREIRNLRKAGWSLRELAEHYKIAAPTVSRICRGYVNGK